MNARWITAAAVAAVLSGCNPASWNMNEGYNRLAVAPPSSGSTAGNTNLSGTIEVDGRGFYAENDGTVGKLIGRNDVFQIKLISAFICNFRENDGTFDALTTSNPFGKDDGPCRTDEFAGQEFAGRGTRGEIAILAGLNFRGENTENSQERVIYYSNDVRETGQMLNFLNLPVYGPAVYLERDATLSLKILELDQKEAEQQSAFLQSLAQAGSTIASPLFGKGFEALAAIGTGFLASNLDDVELAFSAGFDVPGDADSEVLRLRLREGYLILMRREGRHMTDHFTDLQVCPEQGFLAENVSDCAANKPYMKATWLLLRVSKESQTAHKAALAGALLDNIRGAGYGPETNVLKNFTDYAGKLLKEDPEPSESGN